MKLLHHAFRLYVEPAIFDRTIAFYETLQGISCERRIPFPHLGINVAIVGAFIVLAGAKEELSGFREASSLLVVDDLDRTLSWAVDEGATVLHGPQDAPGGRNATVRNPDGLVAEYYQPMST